MRLQYVHVCYAYFVCNVSYIIILITSCIFQQFWLGGPADPYPYVGLIVKMNEVFFWQILPQHWCMASAASSYWYMLVRKSVISQMFY